LFFGEYSASPSFTERDVRDCSSALGGAAFEYVFLRSLMMAIGSICAQMEAGDSKQRHTATYPKIRIKIIPEEEA